LKHHAESHYVRRGATCGGQENRRIVVDHLPLTVFRRSALASGLLTVEQILEAEEELRAARGLVGTGTVIDDDTLAGKLVEQGRLNRWQAEQRSSASVPTRLSTRSAKAAWARCSRPSTA